MHAIFLVYSMRIEQIHILILLHQLKKFIRRNDAERQCLNANFLVAVNFLRIEEFVNIGMEQIEVHYAAAVTLSQLVRIGERILEQLHNRQYPACFAVQAFNLLARCPDFT
ncbi:hypothetical protein D3C77_540060 [compost metagenome]